MTLPPPLTVLPARLHDLEQGSRLEWLEVDGRGGYASSTAIGANTRRYHGLLVVARRPPTDRVVLLSRIEESLIVRGGERFDLSVNFYPGAVHPHGHRYLEEFKLDPWPIWRYRLGPYTLTKALFMARGVGATVLLYHLRGGDALLELRPLVAGRDFHALGRASAIAPLARARPGRVIHHANEDLPPLVLSFRGGDWDGSAEWYWQTVYPRETERGLDDREDLYCIGTLRVPLAHNRPWRLACGTRPLPVGRAADWAAAERRRRTNAAEGGRQAAGRSRGLRELGARLGLAADVFLVERDPPPRGGAPCGDPGSPPHEAPRGGGGRSIIAGYPWFADWGRDALIALPGLCLATGRKDEAAAVLRTFALHLRDGLIPNRFPDAGSDPPDDHYNAVDAPLWFVEGVAALAEQGGDARELWPAVQRILEAYQQGTRFGIGLDGDGLVRHGAEGFALTWMDALVGGPVTPRSGKAVEVNALWYNAARRAAELARALGHDAGAYETLAQRTADAFESFWYESGGYLYDRLDESGAGDTSLRPNQLLAISLPHSTLEPGRARSVVDAVERELLVPLGVRTLAGRDPRYRGRFAGGPAERDTAYHCGTAWPWLLGPFAGAYLRAYGATPRARARVRSLLAPVEAHLNEYGLGHVAEVVAGDLPHQPGGCFAQAWSCAELLRILSLLGWRAPVGR